MAGLPPQLIGQSPAFLATLDRVSQSASLDRSMLVIGERGTGKELIASRLHFLSPRWDKTYLTVNCAALSEELLDSELFGHEAGAFTGASKRRLGRFERADGGTLFLDEIATASHRVQEKLLRVIEYGQFERLGGDQTLTVDVRVIGATNVDLPAAVKAGKFRADLLDRLAFDVVTLPPLRVRKADIAPLADSFGRKMATELGAQSFPGFDPQIMAFMMEHNWPGNVRELKNVAERAVGLSILDDNSFDGPISDITLDPFATPWRPQAGAGDSGAATEEHSSADAPAPSIGETDFYKRVHHYELGLLKAALARHHNHQGKAADDLGLTYHAFRGLLRKHGLKK